MLSHHFSTMSEEHFQKLPSTTNAVESHNRLSKIGKPEILRVAMLTTYKVDMAMALEHMAAKEGIFTALELIYPLKHYWKSQVVYGHPAFLVHQRSVSEVAMKVPLIRIVISVIVSIY